MRRAAAPLAVWSLFVWGLRARNLTGDQATVGAAEIVPVVGFVVAGLVLVSILWRTKGRALLDAERLVIVMIAAVTGVWWLVRGVEIFFDDHSAAFIAVHTVLALVSIGLSLRALTAARRQ